MFQRLIKKNTIRINSMEQEKAPLWKFLTPRSYLIILFMMGLGFSLRSIRTIPDGFFAFFYSGLGLALFLAGFLSLAKYILSALKRRKKEA